MPPASATVPACFTSSPSVFWASPSNLSKVLLRFRSSGVLDAPFHPIKDIIICNRNARGDLRQLHLNQKNIKLPYCKSVDTHAFFDQEIRRGARMKTIAALTVLMSLAAGDASAQQSVTVTGCVAKGVEASCLVLRTVTGKLYDISAAMPKPEVSTYGTVTGVLAQQISFCQQGEIINPATWSLKGKNCPRSLRAK